MILSDHGSDSDVVPPEKESQKLNGTEKLLPSLEAMLFVADGPVSAAQFAGILDIKTEVVEAGLQELMADYEANRGLGLQKHAGKYQLTTSSKYAELVEKFLGLELTVRLSRAALETLAIVAYRQPITRPGIDAIRGVNSDYVLRSLLNKGLVEEVGRAETPGRPILYSVTPDFLLHFGMQSVDDLPLITLEDEEIDDDENNILKD